MKVVSKVTLGVVSLFSLCSCRGRGTKATKEEFIQAVKEIKTEDKISKAKLTSNEVKTTGVGSSEIKVTNKSEGEYKKNSSGEWEAASSKNDKTADLMFITIYTSVDPKGYTSSINEAFASNSDGFKETFYIKPLGYDVSYTNDYYGNQTITQDNYFEWNNYGYLTCISGTVTVKDKTSNKTAEKTKFEVKITYR